jgi:hypothetical protein
VDGRTISKYIFKKWDGRVWTVFIWLSGELLLLTHCNTVIFSMKLSETFSSSKLQKYHTRILHVEHYIPSGCCTNVSYCIVIFFFFSSSSCPVNYYTQLRDKCQCVKEQKLPDSEA